jgi:hypothetical protein
VDLFGISGKNPLISLKMSFILNITGKSALIIQAAYSYKKTSIDLKV